MAFYMKDGTVEAVAGLDRGREVRRARDLVRAAPPWTPRSCATRTWTSRRSRRTGKQRHLRQKESECSSA